MKKALFLLASIVLLGIPMTAHLGLAWWDVSYPYRVPIIANSTTALAISVNGTFGVNSLFVWALQSNDTFVYSTGANCSGVLAIATNTTQSNWYFSANRSGNEPYSVWNSNAVGVYHLDENTGTTAYDMSQQKNNGTLSNAGGWNVGLYSYGYNTTNSGYQLAVPNVATNDNNNNSFTIAMWIRYAGNGTNNYRVLLDRGTEALNRRIAIYKYDNGGSHHIAYRLYGSGGAIELAGTPLSTGWHLMAMVRNKTDSKLYGYKDLNWDGTAISDTAGNVATATTYKIGTNNAGSEAFNNTVIDEVRFYNYSMTLDELRTVYWQGVNNFTMLGTQEVYEAPVVPLNPVVDNTVICFKTQPVCINLKDSTLIYKGAGYYA